MRELLDSTLNDCMDVLEVASADNERLKDVVGSMISKQETLSDMLQHNLMDAEYWRERERVRKEAERLDGLETPPEVTEGAPLALTLAWAERLSKLQGDDFEPEDLAILLKGLT